MSGKTSLKYHVILTTRYRRPALTNIEQTVYAAMREAEARSSFKILDMGIEDGNHIHLVILAEPKYSIASYINRLKGISQKYLWDKEPQHLKKHYWGGKKLWHGSYFCSTIGDVSIDKILEYVKTQNGPRPGA